MTFHDFQQLWARDLAQGTSSDNLVVVGLELAFLCLPYSLIYPHHLIHHPSRLSMTLLLDVDVLPCDAVCIIIEKEMHKWQI